MRKITKLFALLFLGFNLNAQEVILSSSDSLSFASWTFFEVTQGGDGFNWHIADVSAVNGMSSQGYAIRSNSKNPLQPITPNDFAASPPLDMTSYSNAQLSWSNGAGSAVDFAENYSVYVVYDSIPSDNMIPINSSDIVYTETLSAGQIMTTHSVDISSICGKNNVYIMFRHHDCTNQQFLVIDDVLVTSDTTLSTSELNMVKLNIYPVPAKDILSIECAETITALSVFDAQGREVLTDFNFLTNKMTVSSLSKGIYTAIVSTESGNIVTAKFMK